MFSDATSINLDPHLVKFIEAQIAEGHYGSINDVIAAGLRLLEEQETHNETIRQALIDGENSGFGDPIDIKKYFEELKNS